MGREPEKAGRVIKHRASLTRRAGKRVRRWVEAFTLPHKHPGALELTS